jgi:SulP family sulfate permease
MDFFLQFDDLDHGMEWCEEQIISETAIGSNKQKKEIDEIKLFEEKFADLLIYFESKDINQDTTLIEQGSDPDGLYFIKSGRVTVELRSSNNKIRLKSMGTGTVVGEVSLYLKTQATASVISNYLAIGWPSPTRRFKH